MTSFDEYQDINPIQNYILKQFPNADLMVVGDDAQAIYKFRGSDVKYIWDFTNNFKNSKQYMLEMNYRSTKEIINYNKTLGFFNRYWVRIGLETSARQFTTISYYYRRNCLGECREMMKTLF